MKVKDWIIVIVAISILILGVWLLLDGHWILGIILGFPSLFILTIFFSELTNPTQINNSTSSNNNYYTSGYNNIWLEKRKGFTKYQMVGMYYRKLKKSDIGKFEGYAKAEKYNAHDPFAVSIYNNMGKHLGYLPSGNKYIHGLILENNQSLPVYGYISCDKYVNNYIGEVAIKTNTALNIDNPFYDQNVAIVGKFDVTQKELSDILNNLGAYICGSVHENTDILLIGEKMKSTQMIDKFKFLNENGCNIRAIYKDELNEILEMCN